MTIKKAKKFGIGIGITVAAVAAIVLVNKVANWFEGGEAPKEGECDDECGDECDSQCKAKKPLFEADMASGRDCECECEATACGGSF